MIKIPRHVSTSFKLSINVDNIREESSKRLIKLYNCRDKNGNPIEAFQETILGYSSYFVKLNNVEISIEELNKKIEKISIFHLYSYINLPALILHISTNSLMRPDAVEILYKKVRHFLMDEFGVEITEYGELETL